MLHQQSAMGRLWGIWGQPYIDLEPYVDVSAFAELHEEVCLGLTKIDVSYTGGSLKWMKVVSPSTWVDPYVDYGHVISRFSQDEFERFVSLAHHPEHFDCARHQQYRFGDETDHPLSKAQMNYLKYRYGVYFPWKVVFHFVENVLWEDKHSGSGKQFSELSHSVFPKTTAFLKTLPFREIGRCLIFGIEANDHAPLHRDTEPGTRDEPEHSMSLCFAKNKRFILATEDESQFLEIQARAYWFNDMDYHGVAPDPVFRYSIRIDGVFLPEFYERIRNDTLRAT